MGDYSDTDLVAHMLQRKKWCETPAHFNEHPSFKGYWDFRAGRCHIAMIILSHAAQWIRFRGSTPTGKSIQKKMYAHIKLPLNGKCYENCTVLDNSITDKQCN